jgi:hypothetical protein
MQLSAKITDTHRTKLAVVYVRSPPHSRLSSAGKAYVHVRRVGCKGHLVIWADAEERERLGRLRDYHIPGRLNHYPVELTRPKARSGQERDRGARLPVMRMTIGLIGRKPLSRRWND